jgi:hypothetical protein
MEQVSKKRLEIRSFCREGFLHFTHSYTCPRRCLNKRGINLINHHHHHHRHAVSYRHVVPSCHAKPHRHVVRLVRGLCREGAGEATFVTVPPLLRAEVPRGCGVFGMS